MGEQKLDEYDRLFFYPASMLSSNRVHAGIYHDILYNRIRIQAESITNNDVLASKIYKEIIKTYVPSIINSIEGKDR